jgi:hypothetical protein
MTNFKQAEQLIILMEECSEVQQSASKILRFGSQADAIERLAMEMGDLLGIMEWITKEFDINPDDLIQYAKMKQDKMLKWTSYQNK